MRKVIGILAALGPASSAQAFDFTPKARPASPKQEVKVEKVNGIVLDVDNVVIFRDEVSSQSVSRAIGAISASKADTVYLYLDTPGGSVVAGSRLADFLVHTDKNVVCVAQFAASMGFVTLQSCPVRVVSNTAIIMQHEAALALQFAPMPNQDSIFSFFKVMIEDMDKAQAKRIGLSYDAFRAKIRNDWWLYGKAAVDANVADNVESIACTKKAVETTYEEKYATMFGTYLLTWSYCPLEDYPRNIRSPSETAGLLPVVQYLNDRTTFVNKMLGRK